MLIGLIAECKDNANECNGSLLPYCRVPLILCKDTAFSRKQKIRSTPFVPIFPLSATTSTAAGRPYRCVSLYLHPIFIKHDDIKTSFTKHNNIFFEA